MGSFRKFHILCLLASPIHLFHLIFAALGSKLSALDLFALCSYITLPSRAADFVNRGLESCSLSAILSAIPRAGENMAKQNVTINYRRLSDLTGAFGKQTLETAIRNAMNHSLTGGKVLDHWKHRAWGVPPNAEDTLLMNVFHDGASYFFGDLTEYTKGYMRALLSEQADTPTLSVEQEPPPKGKEYVHSMMYWLVVKNHVFLIQSRSLTAKFLEEYLTWLLTEQTATVSAPGHVLLQAKFDSGEMGGDLGDLREIIVGGRAPTSLQPSAKTAEVESLADRDVYQKIGEKRPWHERAMDVLRAVMTNEADVQKLIEKVPDGASLEVSVHIGYKTTKRGVSRAPMQDALRNLPEGEIRAIGKNGQLIGKDIRLSHPTSVTKIGSLLDPADALRALRDAYRQMSEAGKIE